MKINDYPQVDTLQDEDLVLLDTAEGTRTQRVDKLAQNLQEKMTNMFNPTAFTTTNVIADTDYLITSSKDPETEEVVNRKITALDAAEALKAKMDLDGINGFINLDSIDGYKDVANCSVILEDSQEIKKTSAYKLKNAFKILNMSNNRFEVASYSDKAYSNSLKYLTLNDLLLSKPIIGTAYIVGDYKVMYLGPRPLHYDNNHCFLILLKHTFTNITQLKTRLIPSTSIDCKSISQMVSTVVPNIVDGTFNFVSIPYAYTTISGEQNGGETSENLGWGIWADVASLFGIVPSCVQNLAKYVPSFLNTAAISGTIFSSFLKSTLYRSPRYILSNEFTDLLAFSNNPSGGLYARTIPNTDTSSEFNNYNIPVIFGGNIT